MKTDDVRDRMGVYKRLVDVPDERRLYRFATSYEGRDVWAEYVAAEADSESQERRLARVGERWKDHMADRGRHHALAQPADLEAWADQLLGELAVSTVYRKYWTPVCGFYTWLLWHADHRHLYQPAWMAIVENPDGAAAALWAHQREKVQNQRGNA